MTPRRLGLVIGAASLLVVAALVVARRSAEPSTVPASSGSPPVDRRLPVIDVHVHLSPGGEQRLRELMQRHGFDHAVNLSGGHPLGTLTDQLTIARGLGGRVTVFASLAYEQAAEPGYGTRMARLLELSHSMGARGLKIAKALGLGVTGPDGALLTVDDPELDPVFEAAGRLGMPVAIHSGDPEAFWQPVDPSNERVDELEAHPGWSLHGRDVPSFDAILDSLENRVRRHPQTTFISVHFGNCAEDPERVSRMLRAYPNLYVDTAARIPEMGRHPAELMRRFFIEFQDRILYGSDLGVGPPGTALFLGSQGATAPTPEEHELFFSASRRYFESADRDFQHPTPIQGKWTISGISLPRDVLRKVYAENASRVLGIPVPDVPPN